MSNRSDGEGAAEVPTIVGLGPDQAVALIEEHGFVPEGTTPVQPRVHRG